MVETIVLHVGAMKSGTSFLQQQLLGHRDTLASQGVLVLGSSWNAQVRAVKDALQPELGPAWEELVRESRSGDAERAVLSMEFLGPASPPRVRRIVESLRPARVEAVLTVRDLNRSILSLWQETVQNGRWWTFAEYLHGVEAMRPEAMRPEAMRPGPGRGRRNEAGRTFWRQQGVARICRTWREAADQVSLVTVPAPGAPREELLDRFVRSSGLPPLTSQKLPGTGNEALGGASILALRAMNELLAARGVDVAQALPLVKGILAKRILATRRADEPALGLAVPDWVPDAAAAMTRRLKRLNVPLYGDWADLTPVAVPGVDPEDVSAAEVAAAATFAMAGLVEHQLRKRRA